MRRKAVAVVTALVAVLTSCSSSSPSVAVRSATTVPGPTPAVGAPTGSDAFCTGPDRYERLTATRTDAFPQNHITFGIDSPSVSTNVAAIEDVVRAVCAQPKFPDGAISCPADWGITYALEFEPRVGADRVLVVAPTGCGIVRGAGALRWATSAFWDALATAFGVPQPREYCDPFRGRLPGAPADCGPPIG